MNKALKTILLSLLSLVTVGVLIAYFYFRYEIDHMLGGNTHRVDPWQFQAIKGQLAITNVNVLTPDSAAMLPNQTVLVQGNNILSIGEGLPVPNGYQKIEGNGKYLIPGLIDSHVHVKKSENDLLLYLANGVTQIGEMTGMGHHFEYIDDIKHDRLAPGMFIASPKVTSQKGWYPTLRSYFEQRHQNFVTTDSAREAVRAFKTRGFDAIKLSSHVNSEIYYAINDEAKKHNLPVIGHLPVGLTLEDLYRSGQSQLAHIDSITLSLVNRFGGLNAQNAEQFIQYVKDSVDAIAQQFKQHNIALASTVWLHSTRVQQAFTLPEFMQTIEIAYQNPGWLEGSVVSSGCLPPGNSYQYRGDGSDTSKQAYLTFLSAYNQAIKITAQALIKHGVTITAGTDALGACGMIAGFSLHNELTALNALGLSNTQVLQAATLLPANWTGIKTGQLKTGYRADMVLLDNNPLEDIRHTQTIHGVMVNGQYLNRTQLDNMLQKVKTANHESRKVNIDTLLN